MFPMFSPQILVQIELPMTASESAPHKDYERLLRDYCSLILQVSDKYYTQNSDIQMMIVVKLILKLKIGNVHES